MTDVYDVLIVGYGPVGMTAACLLGQAGRRVAVFERYPSGYQLPRVGGVHDDIVRIFQRLGVADQIVAGCSVPTHYDFAHDDEILFESRFAERTEHGWPQLITLEQPFFEAILDRVALESPTVDIFRGSPVVTIRQASNHVEIETENPTSKARQSVRGRYAIACDGGKSFVREALGIELENLGFNQDWIVIDSKIKRRRPDWPVMQQYCNPEQPGMGMQMGPYNRRWAFMLMPGESPEEVVKDENVWQRLNFPGGANADEVTLIRQACYTFRSVISRRWQVGRIFLAGDAAHQMPPYLGQGLCSGIRDAQDLAWKLDLVLSHHASAQLLDTYAAEREPNSRGMLEETIRLGRLVIERDPQKVRERDTWLLAQKAANKTQQLGGYRAPALSAGCLAPATAFPGAGQVFPQARVGSKHGDVRYDDVAGRSFNFLARAGDPESALSGVQREFWAGIHGSSLRLGNAAGPNTVVDVEGAYRRLMDELGCDVVLQRPDHYIFGACRSIGDVPALLDELQRQFGTSSTQSVPLTDQRS